MTPVMGAAMKGPMYFLRENGAPTWRPCVSFAPLYTFQRSRTWWRSFERQNDSLMNTKGPV